MFTQCPDCQTTFRVTAHVLQQADGRVRCGGCGNAFNALENMADEKKSSSESDSQAGTGSTSDQNKKLLETLDKLAGPDLTLEDTGVEWRVLADENADPDATGSTQFAVENEEAPAMLRRQADIPRSVSHAQESLDLHGNEKPQIDPAERRYDDNTILPDDFGSEDDFGELPFLEKPETPKRRAGDREAIQDTSEFDEAQADLALAEPDEWVELLEEVNGDDQPAEAEAEEEAAPELVGGDEPSSDDDAVSDAAAEQAAADEPPEEDMPSDIDTQFLLQAEEMGLDTGSHQIVKEEDVENIDDYLAAAAGEAEAADLDATDIGEMSADEDDEDKESEEAVAEAEEGEPDEEMSLAEDESDEDSDTEEKEEEKPTEELESTGEFEAQIAAAEKALAGEDDEEEEEKEAGEEGSEEPVELELEKEPADKASRETAQPDTDDGTSSTMIGGKDVSELFKEDSALVETIVMEGDMVGDAVMKDRRISNRVADTFEDPGPLEDTYSLNRDKIRGGRRMSDPPSYTVIVSAVVLGLILLVQIMHQSRQSLATYGAFNHTIGSIYRVLGKPVTPEWDVRGWQFEVTSNSVDEEEDLLTIYSRIANNSGQALPYPLVHVSLTDRWEDIVGSRVLEPNDYLAGDLDPRKPVPSGENFTAVITIESPSAEATGFKLTVCYRVAQGRVRCATQDFKN